MTRDLAHEQFSRQTSPCVGRRTRLGPGSRGQSSSTAFWFPRLGLRAPRSGPQKRAQAFRPALNRRIYERHVKRSNSTTVGNRNRGSRRILEMRPCSVKRIDAFGCRVVQTSVRVLRASRAQRARCAARKNYAYTSDTLQRKPRRRAFLLRKFCRPSSSSDHPRWQAEESHDGSPVGAAQHSPGPFPGPGGGARRRGHSLDTPPLASNTRCFGWGSVPCGDAPFGARRRARSRAAAKSSGLGSPHQTRIKTRASWPPFRVRR